MNGAGPPEGAVTAVARRSAFARSSEARPACHHAENSPDSRCIILTDLAHDMRTLTTLSYDWDVAVAERRRRRRHTLAGL